MTNWKEKAQINSTETNGFLINLGSHFDSMRMIYKDFRASVILISVSRKPCHPL